ncbi:recombinase family protein [Streptomyces albidoflavus]
MKEATPGRSWSAADLELLDALKKTEEALPADAPRALLSVRLSVLSSNTTSPVRQELDLRMLAGDRGYRVAGVASDLHVSATKVPPWRRKELGEWLNNRVPEFDALLFWQLDRLIRSSADLSVMIDWCDRHGKNLVSRNDPIDLATESGRELVRLMGSVAEIEGTRGSVRAASLWRYSRSQESWLVGKPAYGFTVVAEGGRSRLAVRPEAAKALRWARRMALRGVSARRMAVCLRRSGLMSDGLTTATLLRRLRNPALLGHRVEEDKTCEGRRSRSVLDASGKPIRVAPAIFTDEEFAGLQEALDRRAKRQPPRRRGGTTQFAGVLVCADCSSNMTVQTTRNKGRVYAYLRCARCRNGGMGAPDPESVYRRLAEDVLKALGELPVQTRRYVPATGSAQGSRSRWEVVGQGRNHRQLWEEGGREAMAEDLLRAGVTCAVRRTRARGTRAPSMDLELRVPADAPARLVVRAEEFPSTP